jgi:hypothetical protein
MSEEEKDRVVKDLDPRLEKVSIPADNPQILDKVDYFYTSYAQFMVTNVDLRIAFGDRTPPKGEVKPVVGIIMTHEHARTFVNSAEKIKLALDVMKPPPNTEAS